MKKILIITLSLSESNGLGRYSRALIKQLSQSYQLVIFSGREEIEKLDQFSNCQFFLDLPPFPNFHKIRNPFIFLKLLFKIYRQAKNVEFIHAFMDYPHSFLAAVTAKLLRVPFFLTANGTYSLRPFDHFPDNVLNRFALKQAKKVICISRFTESEIKKRIKLNNTVVINDGIDFAKFASDTKSIKSDDKFGWPLILGVGILKQRKGYHITIPAIAQVKKYYPELQYLIIGAQWDLEYFNLLKDLMTKYSLEDNVKFLEKISDEELISFYYQCDLFLLTSVNVGSAFEGFGLVFLEAGACGKPVIGTFGCGAEDAIVNNETGLLVPQNNSEKTARAIKKILDDKQLAQRLGANGREHAAQMDWKNIAEKYRQLYNLG